MNNTSVSSCMHCRITFATVLLCVILGLAVIFVFDAHADPLVADIIIDNGAPGTSYTGSWPASGGTFPYGANSLWSRDGATYSWKFSSQPAGTYEVFMWWSGLSNRATNIAVQISTADGISTVNVNQQLNAGKWNSLGQYNFGTGGSVTITAASGSSVSTCADAVKFTYIPGGNVPPAATIDSISPNPTFPGETVTFTGHGSDSDGTIAAYQWRSDKDGVLSGNASFSASILSAGIHTIFFKVQDDKGAWSPEVGMFLYRLGCDKPVRIMPLGDSITYGIGEIQDPYFITGYRGTLHQSLISAGYNVDFVGGIRTGESASPVFDIDHQGTSGITDNETATDVYNYLIANPADIVLLHIGTNALDASPADVEAILNEIDRYNTETTVVLARIINQKTPVSTVTTFNDNVEAMALKRIAQGDKIILVDQEHALTYPNDMWDTWHPNISGYAKMADIWFNALNKILPVCNEFAPFIYTYPVTSATTGKEYTCKIAASGNPAPSLVLAHGPEGMTVDSSGLITWTPSSAGRFDVTAEASNGVGVPDTQSFTVDVTAPATNIIIDNGDPGTSYTGTWQVSGGTTPYGTNSLWARNGPTYTWSFSVQLPGIYDVFMWWSGYSSRPPSAAVRTNSADGVKTVSVNQQQNAGQWNSLGRYYFTSAGSVMITAAAGTTSTCADAVRVQYISAVHVITATAGSNGTISPSGSTRVTDMADQSFTIQPNIGYRIADVKADGASVGAVTSYTFTQVTADHTIDAAFELIPPVPHTITATVSGNGTIAPSGAAIVDYGASQTFLITPDANNHISDVLVDNVSVGVVSQYTFTNVITDHTIQALFAPGAFADIIIDNGNPGTSYTGTWQVSGGTTPYGTNSLWARNGPTYTWQFAPSAPAIYEIFMWWSGSASRPTSAAVQITHGDGVKTVSVNQQQNAGMWNSLGQYYFGPNGSVKITAAAGSTVSTCADAVRVHYVSAVHVITATAGVNGSISPSGATRVTDMADQTFTIQPDIGYKISDVKVDGASVGAVPSFTFTQVTSDRTIEATFALDATRTTIIIDNGAPGTSYTGAWDVSSAPNPYGADSVWSRNGTTYTWRFTTGVSGTYQISMWWTYTSSRSIKVPVDIEYWGGSDRVYIDQQANAGLWNLLGAYPFEAGQTYAITITSQPGPSSTCADALRFVLAPGNVAPLATIDSIAPNPAIPGETVTFSGSGADLDGTITDYSWYSSLDGPLSSQPSFSTSTLSTGIHTIIFNVKDNYGVWSAQVEKDIYVSNYQAPTTEDIFVTAGYASVNALPLMLTTLQDMGAAQQPDGTWTYLNAALNKEFIIHIITDIEGFANALKTEGAHILYFGHSNYGLGQSFATDTEFREQVINNILYVDDDRILATSSPWISVNLHYLRTTQAYTFWWPVFKDGTSGIMPYVFGDPRGDPAYNYYVTYQVPGDPTYYKITYTYDGADTAIVRFPDSGKSAWYSSTGAVPDPSNPDHQKYYITNTSSWSPSFQTTGTWTASQTVSGYYLENYIYTPAGQGGNEARWFFDIPMEGNYDVSAWWSSSSARTSGAPYTISSASGDTTVQADQRINGSRWNKLGTFNFGIGNYSVLLTDNAPAGNVVADAIKVSDPGNPPEVIQVNFSADVRSGTAPLTVNFTGTGTGDVSKWSWNFGDGGYINLKDGGDTVQYIYEKAGTYTVTLTGYGSLGNSTVTKTGYITVGPASPPLQAEFSLPSTTTRQLPFSVTFTDRSTGSIASRLWEFGDGATSTSKSPSHSYSLPGIYTVKLTVTGTDGSKSTETKQNVIRAVVFEKIVDNVDYPKNHFDNKTILFRKDLGVPKDQMRYARMFYTGCDSGHYFTDTFNRGIMFFAVKSTGEGEIAMSQYLREYMNGKSDYELWRIIQEIQPVYDYYDFRKTPSQQW